MKAIALRGLLLVVVTAAIIAGALAARTRLQATTQQRIVRGYQQSLAALDDHQAIGLLRRLAQDEVLWLPVLVVGCTDSRPTVAEAARSELRELVERWADMPPEDSSPLTLELAELMAEQAPQLAADDRNWAHALAQRLIHWPITDRRVNIARHIANCETVLLLPRAEPLEVRIAVLPSIANQPSDPVPTALPSAPRPVTIAPPAVVASPAIVPVEPMPLENTNTEQAIEPRRFIAPRGTRISGN